MIFSIDDIRKPFFFSFFFSLTSTVNDNCKLPMIVNYCSNYFVSLYEKKIVELGQTVP